MSSSAKLLADARQHHEAGRLDEAEQAYQQVLDVDPLNVVATHLYGGVLFQLGKHADAIRYLKRSVEMDPQWPAFQLNLANVCMAAGYIDDAKQAFLRILQHTPNDHSVHKKLGTIAYQQDRITEARQHYETAASLQPEDFEAQNFVGVVLSNQGFSKQAAGYFRRAVELNSGYVEAYNNLGTELRALNRPEDSLKAFQKAIVLAPESPDAHNGLGCAYKALGQHAAALTEFKETLRLAPEHPDGHNNRGATLTEMGRFPEAVECFQHSLTLWPAHAFAWRNLVELFVQGHHEFSEAEFLQLAALRTADNLSPADASQILFALATIYEKREDADAAFLAFQEANEFKRNEFDRRGRLFDPAQHRHAIDHHITVLNSDSTERIQNSGVDSRVPVFVVGMPRSGTSLVEQILASHSQIYGAGELHEIRKITEELRDITGVEVGYPDGLLQTDATVLQGLAERHLDRLSAFSGGADRVVDKMPENYFYLPLLFKLFPNASVIHCQRDPAATCVSCWRRNFDNVRWACDLSDIGFYYTQYERLMGHWRQSFQNRILNVSYEDLVNNSEAVSQEMIAYCGLEWDDECLEFFSNRRAVRTASTLQVRKPIYTTSISAWERYRPQLEPLFEALGEFAPAD